MLSDTEQVMRTDNVDLSINRADETYRARVRVSSREYVGMIVGRAGKNILDKKNAILDDTGNQLCIQNPAEQDEPIFSIYGKSHEAVMSMAKWIQDKNLALENRHYPSVSQENEKSSVLARCCVKYVSLLVGPQGSTVKSIMAKTNTDIQSPPKNSNPKYFTISGSEGDIELAVTEMKDYMMKNRKDQSSSCDDCRKFGLQFCEITVISTPYSSELTHIPQLIGSSMVAPSFSPPSSVVSGESVEQYNGTSYTTYPVNNFTNSNLPNNNVPSNTPSNNCNYPSNVPSNNSNYPSNQTKTMMWENSNMKYNRDNNEDWYDCLKRLNPDQQKPYAPEQPKLPNLPAHNMNMRSPAFQTPAPREGSELWNNESQLAYIRTLETIIRDTVLRDTLLRDERESAERMRSDRRARVASQELANTFSRWNLLE